MPIRRNPEDLTTQPGKIFFDMIREYSDGTLGNVGRLYRARVEGVDPVGGAFAQNPPNPARSVRARVYSSGMDASTPEEALGIFYPLFPNVVAQQGEHVVVMFEDEQRTSGFWLNVVPAFSADQNYSNPDFRQQSSRDSSYVFESEPRVQSTINLDLEYGGGTLSTTGRQEMVDLAESSSENPWENERVLAVGDSQMAGPFGAKLGDVLRNQKSIATYQREGRVSWGVISWLNNRKNSTSPVMPSLRDLISQHSPTVLIISLGGNDAGGAGGRRDYQDKVRELLSQASGVEKIIWSGPPTVVGRSAPRQTSRQMVARKIQEVLGDRFVDVSSVTNTSVGRDAAGLHFAPSSPAITPWVDLVVRKGHEIF